MESFLQSPLGCLKLSSENEELTTLEVVGAGLFGKNREIQSSPLHHLAHEQLQAYFDGRLRFFSIPVRIATTLFRYRVYKVLQELSYGETVVYSEVARRCETPNAARAVGSACAQNPLPLIVPCHRVVARKGLSGYIYGTEVKGFLLQLEQSY